LRMSSADRHDADSIPGHDHPGQCQRRCIGRCVLPRGRRGEVGRLHQDVRAAIDQIAQTTLRKVVGQHTLDQTCNLHSLVEISVDQNTTVDVPDPLMRTIGTRFLPCPRNGRHEPGAHSHRQADSGCGSKRSARTEVGHGGALLRPRSARSGALRL